MTFEPEEDYLEISWQEDVVCICDGHPHCPMCRSELSTAVRVAAAGVLIARMKREHDI